MGAENLGSKSLPTGHSCSLGDPAEASEVKAPCFGTAPPQGTARHSQALLKTYLWSQPVLPKKRGPKFYRNSEKRSYQHHWGPSWFSLTVFPFQLTHCEAVSHQNPTSMVVTAFLTSSVCGDEGVAPGSCKQKRNANDRDFTLDSRWDQLDTCSMLSHVVPCRYASC